MRAYVTRRLLLMVPTLFLVSLITFSVVNAMPGDVITARLFESPAFRPEDLEQQREQLGLDRPAYVQYFRWLSGVLQGDFGNSLWSDRSVSAMLIERLPLTLELAAMAFVLSAVLGIAIGVVSAVTQDSWLDYLLRITSISGLSVPSFWLGVLFVVLAARWFNYLSPLVYNHPHEDLLANIKQLLPGAAIIAVASTAAISRMTRSAMLEVLRQDYIRTAWAKGLHARVIILRHALKNALIPVLSIAGLQVTGLLSGSVIAESVFNLPGMGRLMLSAVNQRDYIVIQGITLWIAGAVVVVNLVVDMLYAYLNPRIRY